MKKITSKIDVTLTCDACGKVREMTDLEVRLEDLSDHLAEEGWLGFGEDKEEIWYDPECVEQRINSYTELCGTTDYKALIHIEVNETSIFEKVGLGSILLDPELSDELSKRSLDIRSFGTFVLSVLRNLNKMSNSAELAAVLGVHSDVGKSLFRAAQVVVDGVAYSDTNRVLDTDASPSEAKRWAERVLARTIDEVKPVDKDDASE